MCHAAAEDSPLTRWYQSSLSSVWSRQSLGADHGLDRKLVVGFLQSAKG